MIANEAENFSKEFGAFIREGRQKQGLYQADIAEQVGISRAHYTHIETGDRQIYFELAVKICRILNLDISDFIKNI